MAQGKYCEEELARKSPNAPMEDTLASTLNALSITLGEVTHALGIGDGIKGKDREALEDFALFARITTQVSLVNELRNLADDILKYVHNLRGKIG